MKSFLRTFVAVVLAQSLLVLLLVGLIAGKAKVSREIQDGSVLVQTLDGEIPESASPGLPPFLGRGPVTHTAILENLEKARRDRRIKAVVLKVGAPQVGWAKMDEWRERIGQLRAAGKPVWTYTEALNRGGLYIGSACDSLFILPTGYVSLHGFASERPFFAGTLKKLGIKQNIHRIEKYKSAAEMVQRDSLSPESRANVQWMLDTYYPEFLAAVETGRKLVPGTIESSVFKAGALGPGDVLSLGLVDRLLYWDEVETRLLRISGVKAKKDAPAKTTGRNGAAGTTAERAGLTSRPRTVDGSDYAQIDRRAAGIKAKQKIAVVHAQGTIQGEESGMSFPWGVTMGAGTMDAAFRSAAEDKEIKAIVFRIDSGGGESSTSWRIQRSALRAAQTKPVVVSMCDMAASGAYLIAYPCETLVADRLSVVGSIGSISGKFNMRGFYDKIGLTKDSVTRGANALMESDYFDYTAEEWTAFTSRHWRDYEEWVDDVARARHKTPAEIDSIGRGRVWTGEQALARGLVDTLGTFDLAVQLAKQKAGIPAGEDVVIVNYPKKESPLEALRRGGMAAAAFALVDQVVQPWQKQTSWAIDQNRYW
jgi:protease IV